MNTPCWFGHVPLLSYFTCINTSKISVDYVDGRIWVLVEVLTNKQSKWVKVWDEWQVMLTKMFTLTAKSLALPAATRIWKDAQETEPLTIFLEQLYFPYSWHWCYLQMCQVLYEGKTIKKGWSIVQIFRDNSKFSCGSEFQIGFFPFSLFCKILKPFAFIIEISYTSFTISANVPHLLIAWWALNCMLPIV